MKAKLKKRWIAALRSGEYRQCRGYLRNQEKGRDGFCCLGVLCDILDKNGWVDDGHKHPYHSKGSVSGFLKYTTCQEIGLNHSVMNELSTMNDNGKRFTTIAKYIEDNIETTS